MRKPAQLFVAMDFGRITKEEALKKELVDAYSFMLTEAGKKHVWMRQQLIGEMKKPIPASPGQPAKHDYEYKRSGEILRWPAAHYHPVMLVHPV